MIMQKTNYLLKIYRGDSDVNANFVPVAVDWRERVERAKRIAANKDNNT